MRTIVVIAHNLRSTHNIGSLLRTAEGLGVNTVYLTGYSPYPAAQHDDRLPHIAQKLHKQIQKTALGAETFQNWQTHSNIMQLLDDLTTQNYEIVALEQTDNTIPLPDWKPAGKVAIVLGREVEGLEQAVIDKCSFAVEIPMFGQKESFNVVQAAAMALYHCRFA